MILSMTGYGQANKELNNKIFRIEIKSLNGKSTDIRFKSNTNLKEKEIELRKLIHDIGIRGKFDVSLSVESTDFEDENTFNIPLMNSYIKNLKSFAVDHNIESGDLIQSIIRLPNIVKVNDDSMLEEEWLLIKEMTQEALDQLMHFRKEEGQSLENDILARVRNINQLLLDVDHFEPNRISSFKEKIMKNLELYLSKDNIDENRFEQEVIYYLEKLDINEEKVRLAQHSQFFENEVMDEKKQKGKKLSFISQEIGREINTLGAKAQQSDIQQIVVRMKDELEKIKEQVLNIL